MSSAFSGLALLAAMTMAGTTSAGGYERPHTWLHVDYARAAVAPERDTVLRVCADPHNLPFSNDRGEGFENAIASLAATALGRQLVYYWLPQRRGFIRNTVKAGLCDVVIGMPAESDMLKTTTPYYRSTYVFVTRHGTPPVRSLDDPRLARLRVGVQVIGDDYANAPAAQALANRGLTAQVRGFPVYGDYNTAIPLRSIVDAVVDRSIDVAVVWGPIAGDLASRVTARLDLTPVTPQIDLPYLPFVFDIAMGVRRDDPALADALNGFIDAHARDIDAILRAHHVPTLPGTREADQ